MMVIIKSLCCRVSDPLKSNIFVIVRGSDYRGDGGKRPPNILVGGRKGKCPPTDCPFSKIFRTYFPFG